MSKPSYNQKESPMSEYRYTVLFEPAEKGGYVATCPALPGLGTEGDTLDEARAMVRDALRGYLGRLARESWFAGRPPGRALTGNDRPAGQWCSRNCPFAPRTGPDGHRRFGRGNAQASGGVSPGQHRPS